eukprot:s2149_g6.t4
MLDDATICSFLLTIAKGFLPCSSAGQLVNSSRELQELKSEELWRQCYLEQYPERLCRVAFSWRCRLAMRQPLRDLRLEGTTEAVLDWEAALLVLGSPWSGKTWLVHRFCQGRPPECLDKVPFLGTNLRVSHLQLRGPLGRRTGRLRIWEPSGVSRQQALGGYLKAAQMVLVCVDLEDLKCVAFEAQRLLEQVMQSMRPGTILGLCGLKSDRLTAAEQRRFAATLRPLAHGRGAEFGMCSARTRGMAMGAGRYMEDHLRSDGEWLRDPLLWYRFLPFESLGGGATARGFRALLLTLLFYGQIVAIVIPVLLVFALAVCHDGVHATVRADLLRRDAGEHFYLLDFIMAPSINSTNIHRAVKMSTLDFKKDPETRKSSIVFVVLLKCQQNPRNFRSVQSAMAFLVMICCSLWSLLLGTVQACSNFAMQNDFGLSVRTMDLGDVLGLSWSIVSLPSTDASKHSLVGFAATLGGIPQDGWLFAGMNDAGLTCDAQTLIGTQYPSVSNASVDVLHLCRWALESCSSLEELKEKLSKVEFSAGVASLRVGGLHWMLRDSRRGVVLEFLEGRLVIHEDPNDGKEGFGIMTNEPPYAWQVEAVKHLQWKESLARTAVSVPGSWYPDDRFQRIFWVKRGMPQPKDYQEAVMQAVHVLNTVTVPMGLQMGTDSGKGSGEGSADHTQWGVIYDHHQGIIYWRSAENQNLQRLQLRKLWASGQKRHMSAKASQLAWFHDVVMDDVSELMEEII